MNEELVRNLKELFGTLDTNNDGIISLTEICEGFKKVNAITPMENAIESLSIFGENYTSLTYDEFKKKMFSGPEPFKLGVLMIFLYYSKNEAPTLSFQDLKDIAKIVDPETQLDITKGLDAVSKSKKCVDFESFYKRLCQAFK